MDYESEDEKRRRVGARIREVRSDAGETMAEMGKKLQVSLATVYSWESGKSNISEKNIDLICSTYHVSKEWIIGKDMPKVPESKEHMDLRNALDHAMLFMSDVELMKTENFITNILEVPYHSGVQKEDSQICL